MGGLCLHQPLSPHTWQELSPDPRYQALSCSWHPRVAQPRPELTMKSMLLSSFRKYSISFSKRCCSPHTWVGGMAVTEVPGTYHLSRLPAAHPLMPLWAPLKLNLSQATSFFCSKPLAPLDLSQPSPTLTPFWPLWHPSTFLPQGLCTCYSTCLMSSY